MWVEQRGAVRSWDFILMHETPADTIVMQSPYTVVGFPIVLAKISHMFHIFA